MPHLRRIVALCTLLMVGSTGWSKSSGRIHLPAEFSGKTYTARLGNDGNLQSVRIGGVEMLDAEFAFSRGAFFRHGAEAVRLRRVEREDNHITAIGGDYRVEYAFQPRGIRLTLHQTAESRATYMIVLSPASSRIVNPDTGDGADLPATQAWRNMRFITPTGPCLTIGSRVGVTFPWEAEQRRQVWQVSVPRAARYGVTLNCQTRTPIADFLFLSVTSAHDDALFAGGEKASATVKLTSLRDMSVPARIALQLRGYTGRKPIISQSWPVKIRRQEPFTVSQDFELQTPGFYRVDVQLRAGKKTLKSKQSIIGYEIDRLGLDYPSPPDFDAFWDGVMAAARQQPLEPYVAPTPEYDSDQVSVAKVSFASLDGIRIHGWLCTPKLGDQHPALLLLPSAGIKPLSPPRRQASRGFVTLAINVHGVDVDIDKYDARNYTADGMESRETYVFRRLYAHSARAVDYLAQLPQVDPQGIGVVGYSQGGALAIAAAALNPHVVAAVAGMPVLCRTDWILKRYGGFGPSPKLMPAGMTVDQALDTLQYFDIAHLARRVHCPTLMTVGLRDRTAPPPGIVSAFNRLAAEHKELRVYPGLGHMLRTVQQSDVDAWLEPWFEP